MRPLVNNRQKTEGNMDDVQRVIKNLNDGMVWDTAKHHESFMVVNDDWYEKNKELILKWKDTGIPVPDDMITNRVVKPAPMSVVAENGKIWGVYRNTDGTIYREEIKEKSKDDVPAPPPDTGRLMTAEVRKK